MIATTKKILYIILIVAWLAIIFCFSARDGTESTGDSRGFLTNMVETCVRFANRIGIIEEIPSDGEMMNIVHKLDYPIRKVAHTAVYFVLAILILMALGTNRDNFIRNAIIATACCFIFALADEFHQTFVPGRSGELTDCLIDTLGAGLACCFYGIGVEIKHKHKK